MAALVTRRRHTGCAVCAERRRQEQLVHEVQLAHASRTPATRAEEDGDDSSWFLAILLAGAFALIFIISGRVRELRDQVDELVDEEQPEGIEVGEG